MNQLSIIYLVMCSVLLVSVMLISISPDSANEITTPGLDSKGEAVQGFSGINIRGAAAPGFGQIPLSFAANKGQMNERTRFYLDTSRYLLRMNREGLLIDMIRKAERDGIDTPRPFLRLYY